MKWSARLRLFPLLLAIAGSAAAAKPEDELRAEWNGTYVVTRVALFSECSDHFTDNRAADGRLSSSESRRFEVGEVARVSGLDLGWTGLKLRLELAEPYRVTWNDGPFTLHRISRCRAEVGFDLPREARKTSAAASPEIARLFERFPSLAAAQASPRANGRRVEPLPADWERTRAEYEAWKTARVNEDVERKLAWAIDQANRILGGMEDDPAYLAAFAEGVASRRYSSSSSCPLMLDATYYPSERKKGEGWTDGEALAFYVQLARDLRQCFTEGHGPGDSRN
jgi:hypothetical protein